MKHEIVYLHPPHRGFSRLHVEIPQTFEEMRIGLSGRRFLPPDHGMLFVFHHAEPSIWMKDTFIPLDIAFIDEDGRILSIDRGVPMSLDKHRGPPGSRYVLEANAGALASRGIVPGSFIRV